MDTLNGGNSFKTFLTQFGKDAYSKRKEFAPKWRELFFFPFKVEHFFRTGLVCTKANRKSQNIYQVYPVPLNGMHFHAKHSGQNFSRRHFEIFFYHFPQKTGFDISCKLSPLGTNCMKCQSLLSGKIKKKNISPICRLLK